MKLADMKRTQLDTLGFVPQKEIIYNKLLPYADRLDDESNELLKKIKGNLSRTVQLGEIRPGALFWTRKLSTYVTLHYNVPLLTQNSRLNCALNVMLSSNLGNALDNLSERSLCHSTRVLYQGDFS